jgi:hypothetical protein
MPGLLNGIHHRILFEPQVGGQRRAAQFFDPWMGATADKTSAYACSTGSRFYRPPHKLGTFINILFFK